MKLLQMQSFENRLFALRSVASADVSLQKLWTFTTNIIPEL